MATLVRKFTDEEKKVVVSFFKDYNKADASSIELFKLALNFFMTNKGVERKVIKASLTRQISDIVSIDGEINAYLKAKVKKIVNTAETARQFNLFVENKGEFDLYYTTLESLLKLMQFISDNAGELPKNLFGTVRDNVKDLLKADYKNKVALNNAIKAYIDEVKKENNINGEDDELTFSFEAVKNYLLTLDDTKKAEIIALLSK